VGNDAWAIAGAEAAARLARLAGDGDAERESARLASALREHFTTALARVPGADVPASWPGLGRDWGNFAVSYPTRVLPPSHPRVRALVARGLQRGLPRYGSPDSLHAYLGADLAMDALLDGRGEMARARAGCEPARAAARPRRSAHRERRRRRGDPRRPLDSLDAALDRDRVRDGPGRGAEITPMSRRTRRRAPPGTGPERSGTRAAKRRPRGAGLAVWLVTIAVIAALGLRLVRTGRPRRAHGTPTAVAPVPLDSVASAARALEAATVRGDWAEAPGWQQRIARALPRHPPAPRPP